MATSINRRQQLYTPNTSMVQIRRRPEHNFSSITPIRSWSESRNIIPRKIFRRVEELGPDGKTRKKLTRFVASDRYAPVTLPEEVVRLFQQPHQFPKFGPDEMLIKSGYPARIVCETPLNSFLVSKAAMTFDEKRIRAIIKHRETLWTSEPRLLPGPLGEFRVTNVHEEKRQKIEVVGEETYKVPYRGDFVLFKPVRVNVMRLRQSVVDLYLNKKKKNNQE